MKKYLKALILVLAFASVAQALTNYHAGNSSVERGRGDKGEPGV